MIKGILKTAGVLASVLIVGVALSRLSEVWAIIVSFYTSWSLGLVMTLLSAGAVTAVYASKQLDVWKKGEREIRIKRREKRLLKEKEKTQE